MRIVPRKLDRFVLVSKSIFLVNNINNVVLLIALGVISRLISLPPNFTPITSIALFASITCKRSLSFSIPLLIMLITDFFNGFAPIWYVYLSFLAISYLGVLLKNKFYKNSIYVGTSAFISSLVFFVISNFGVWISTSFYSKNLLGLLQCYYMAIPFFGNTLISLLLFNSILFGVYYRTQARSNKIANTAILSV